MNPPAGSIQLAAAVQLPLLGGLGILLVLRAHSTVEGEASHALTIWRAKASQEPVLPLVAVCSISSKTDAAFGVMSARSLFVTIVSLPLSQNVGCP